MLERFRESKGFQKWRRYLHERRYLGIAGDAEKQYYKFRDRNLEGLNRIFLGLVLLVIVPFFYKDYVLYEQNSYYFWHIVVRLILVAFIGGVIIYSLYARDLYSRYSQRIMLGTVTFGMFLILLNYSLHGRSSDYGLLTGYGVGSLMLVIFSIGCWSGLQLKFATPLTMLCWIYWNAYYFWANRSLGPIEYLYFHSNLLILSSIVICVGAGISIDVLFRRLFLSANDLRLANDELRTISANLGQQGTQLERVFSSGWPDNFVVKWRRGDRLIAQNFDAIILFADIREFTKITKDHAPTHLVEILSDMFTRFDTLVEKRKLYKIKTTGDGYLAAAGINGRDDSRDHKEVAREVAFFSFEMLDAAREVSRMHDDEFSLRIGIHCGSVIAGIIGAGMPLLDVWGETVNIAARVESGGTPGQIHVTAQFRNRIKTFDDLLLNTITRKLPEYPNIELFQLTKQDNPLTPKT